MVMSSKVIMYCIAGAQALQGNNAEGFGPGMETSTIHLKDLGCTGDEEDLFKCPRINDECEHNEDASLVCQSDNGKVMTTLSGPPLIQPPLGSCHRFRRRPY